VTLLVLSNKERPRGRCVVFVLGLLTVLAAIGIAVLAIGAHTVQHAGGSSDTRSAIIDLVIAVGLLALGIRTLRHSPDPNKKHKPHAERHGLQARRYFVFGLFMMSINLTTTFLYFDAMKEIAHSAAGDADRGIVWAIIATFAMLPALVPLIGYVVAPGPAERSLGKLNAYLAKHSRGIGAGVCFVFAAYLAVKGISGL